MQWKYVLVCLKDHQAQVSCEALIDFEDYILGHLLDVFPKIGLLYDQSMFETYLSA